MSNLFFKCGKYLKNIIALILFILPGLLAFSQDQNTFPAELWERVNPSSAGWSLVKLEEAKRFFDSLPPASVIVIDHGKEILEWGDPAMRIKISSMRKSLLSALFGIYRQKGKIDIEKDLSELSINDNPPLTKEERKATVRMLLEARSGIYHSYVAGTPDMREDQPARGSHLPGSFWYYNNWDFNTLGTIFEQQTQTKIADAFRDKIANPIGMQDYRIQDMYYLRAPADAFDYEKSIHPAYHFRITARDMARFGYLFLNNGNWNAKQVVPKDWVAESTSPYSDTGNGEAYGYLWWLNGFGLPDKSISARGALGKYLVIFPERGVVIVYLNHTEFPDDTHKMSAADLKKLPTETYSQMSHLLSMLLAAEQKIN